MKYFNELLEEVINKHYSVNYDIKGVSRYDKKITINGIEYINSYKKENILICYNYLVYLDSSAEFILGWNVSYTKNSTTTTKYYSKTEYGTNNIYVGDGIEDGITINVTVKLDTWKITLNANGFPFSMTKRDYNVPRNLTEEEFNQPENIKKYQYEVAGNSSITIEVVKGEPLTLPYTTKIGIRSVKLKNYRDTGEYTDPDTGKKYSYDDYDINNVDDPTGVEGALKYLIGWKLAGKQNIELVTPQESLSTRYTPTSDLNLYAVWLQTVDSGNLCFWQFNCTGYNSSTNETTYQKGGVECKVYLKVSYKFKGETISRDLEANQDYKVLYAKKSWVKYKKFKWGHRLTVFEVLGNGIGFGTDSYERYEWLKYENFGGIYVDFVFDTKVNNYIANNNLLCVYRCCAFDQDNSIANPSKCLSIHNQNINGEDIYFGFDRTGQDPTITSYNLYSGYFTFDNLLNATKQLKIKYQLKLYSSDYNNYFSKLGGLSVTDKVQFGNSVGLSDIFNFRYQFYGVKYGNII